MYCSSFIRLHVAGRDFKPMIKKKMICVYWSFCYLVWKSYLSCSTLPKSWHLHIWLQRWSWYNQWNGMEPLENWGCVVLLSWVITYSQKAGKFTSLRKFSKRNYHLHRLSIYLVYFGFVWRFQTTMTGFFLLRIVLSITSFISFVIYLSLSWLLVILEEKRSYTCIFKSLI